MKQLIVTFVSVVLVSLIFYLLPPRVQTIVVDSTATKAVFDEKNKEVANLKEKLKEAEGWSEQNQTFIDERCTCVPYGIYPYGMDDVSKKDICSYEGWE